MHNRYLLMRHGHSQANARRMIVSSPERGLAGFGLSPEGEAQLEALLANWRWPVPTGILHSDFRRTTETAARVATRFGLALEAEPRLRERHFGELEGADDGRYPEVWARDAENADHRTFGVEPVSAVAIRMRDVIEALEARHRGETLLLVSHGDPLQILLTALAGRPLTRHRELTPLAPASVTPYPG
jgi:broad specificity phosphatase PhoE